MPRNPQDLVLSASFEKKEKKLNFSKSYRSFEKEIFFLLLIGCAAFFFLSIFSFSPLDPSPVSGIVPEIPPTNRGGQLGAMLAGWSFFLFGLGTFLLPLPLFAISFLLVLNRPEPFAVSRIFGWIMAIFSVSTLTAIKFFEFSFAGFQFPSGGLLGAFIGNLLNQSVGELGTLIILGTLSFCSLTLIFQNSIASILLGAVKYRYHFRAINISGVLKTLKSPTSLLVEKLFHKKSAKNGCSASLVTEGDESAASQVLQEPKVLSTHASAWDEEASHDERMFSPNDQKKGQQRFAKKYTAPPLAIFHKSSLNEAISVHRKEEYQITAELLLKTLSDFDIEGTVIGYLAGPVVTVFEYQPSAGIKLSKILGLADDIALALKVDSIFIHPVKGKHAIGIQVPNSKRETVLLGDIVTSEGFQKAPSPLTFAMGKSIAGQPVFADLSVMPHLLVAGATGSGKSVAINSLLCSIILRTSPEDVRMILVDPKMLELSVYEGIPHLLMPVITEPHRASAALRWAAKEMERRYKLMQLASVRNIAGFNQFWERASLQQREDIGQAADDEEPIGKLPYIVLVIDELADLMMTAPKDVEASIQRLAQKARASGIHLVFATQRPSVDVITGVIKANLPCRIAFQVVSKHDSRTILDQIGAEKLLGRGDMLFQLTGSSRLERIQGALVTDEEVLNLVASVKSSSPAKYDHTIISWINDELSRQQGPLLDVLDEHEEDPKFGEAVEIAQLQGAISASYLQRQLKIGYNRAARIVETMESKGMVAKADGVKPRKWLGAPAV